MIRNQMMLMIALAVMSGSFPSGKQDRSGVAGDQPPRVHVSLTALRTPADGPTSVTWTSSNDLAVGATEGWGFEIKENPCSYGSLGFGDPQTRRLSWTVQFTPVSAATDKIVLDVTVERRDRSVLVKRETRHLTLAEDAPHVLDFAEVGNESTDCPRNTKNFVLETSASIVESPAFASEMLSYDVWLTQRDAHGHEWTSHDTRSARQGERVEYKLGLRWPMTALTPAINWDATLTESISGAIRGRVRDDGAIDVSLTTNRQFAVGQGTTGDGVGQKNFTVRPGEPVSVVLPPPRGWGGVRRPDGSQTKLVYSELFNNHTTAVVVAIHRR